MGWSRWANGQTIGMRAFGVRVVAMDGAGVGLGRAVARLVGLGIAVVPFFLGVLWILFDAAGRGWHDRIADTVVVRVA